MIFIPESVATVAEPCNVTVTGFKAGSETPAVTQTLVFEPAEAVDVQKRRRLGRLRVRFGGCLAFISLMCLRVWRRFWWMILWGFAGVSVVASVRVDGEVWFRFVVQLTSDREVGFAL